MNTSQLRRVGFVLCAVVAAVVVALVSRDPDGSPVVGVAASPVSGTSARSAGEYGPPTREGDRIRIDPADAGGVAAGSRRIVVVDDIGGPIPNATMYRSGVWAPYATLDSAIATADELGRIEWRPTTQDAADTLWVVGAGFLPGGVDASAEEQTVQLRPGASFAVHCIDESGQPIPGVRVALGCAEHGAPPLVEALSESTRGAILPGPTADRAVHAGVSGADGVARFTGIRPSRYYFGIDHPCMVKTDVANAARAPQGGVLVPGPDLVVTLAHAFAAVVCHPGQEMVTCIGTVPRDQFESRLQSSGCSSVQELRATHADGLVLSHIPARRLRSIGRAPRTKIALLLSHSGWVELDLEFQRVADGVTPVVLGAPTEPMCLRRQFTIRPALPEVPGFAAPSLEMSGEFEGRIVSTRVHTGQAFWIPAGRYRVSAASQFVASAVTIPTFVEVSNDGPIDILLERRGDLIPCEFRFHLPRGMLLSSLSDVSAQHESGSYVYWPGWHAMDARVMPSLSMRQWLLPGRVVLRATEPCLGPVTREVDLTVRDTIAILELEWRGS